MINLENMIAKSRRARSDSCNSSCHTTESVVDEESKGERTQLAIYIYHLAQTTGPRDEDPPLVGTPGPDYHRGEVALMVPRSIRRMVAQTQVFGLGLVTKY
jgi:hypothetical protein